MFSKFVEDIFDLAMHGLVTALTPVFNQNCSSTAIPSWLPSHAIILVNRRMSRGVTAMSLLRSENPFEENIPFLCLPPGLPAGHPYGICRKTGKGEMLRPNSTMPVSTEDVLTE
jgi:hypothetical protein